jgi:exonuclease SbcD
VSRILATGDWHCGSGLDYGRTPQDRLADQEQTYERIVDVAIEHDVDAVVLAGDLWHRRRPTPAELLAVARPLRRLRAESTCDIVAICGNHCVESADSPIALELLEDVLDVYRQPAIVETRAGALALLPWTPVSRLVASRGGGDRDDTHEMAAQLLLDVCRDLRSQHDGGLVLVPHWSIEGASTPTGILTDEFREPVIPLAALVALGFDAVIAAHIHRQQVLNEDPFVAYVGSPAPVDFSEGDTDHGCLLLELSA